MPRSWRPCRSRISGNSASFRRSRCNRSVSELPWLPIPCTLCKTPCLILFDTSWTWIATALPVSLRKARTVRYTATNCMPQKPRPGPHLSGSRPDAVSEPLGLDLAHPPLHLSCSKTHSFRSHLLSRQSPKRPPSGFPEYHKD